MSSSPPSPTIPAGLHHFRLGDGERRAHLRVEPDGEGIAVIDASRVLYLNRTAMEMAWLRLSGFSEKRAIGRLRKDFPGARARIRQDWRGFTETFDRLLDASPSEPVVVMDAYSIEPDQVPVTAPLRVDLALTYRCNVACPHCYNGGRSSREISSEEWKRVMGRLWDLGVPHVVFTGGEATLRQDLVELTEHAESLGLVTGLLSNGVRLADPGLVDSLSAAGLDHVQITLESADPEIHDRMVGCQAFQQTLTGLRNCLAAGLHTLTNTTITRTNRRNLLYLLQLLHDEGVRVFAMNTLIRAGGGLEGGIALDTLELEPFLLEAVARADELGLRMIWYSPTRYCKLDPIELGLGHKKCSAASASICIEPDGSVLPCQSWYEVAGNILEDDWDSIWNGPLFSSIRAGDYAAPECSTCLRRPVCGGGCPLERIAEGELPAGCLP